MTQERVTWITDSGLHVACDVPVLTLERWDVPLEPHTPILELGRDYQTRDSGLLVPPPPPIFSWGDYSVSFDFGEKEITYDLTTKVQFSVEDMIWLISPFDVPLGDGVGNPAVRSIKKIVPGFAYATASCPACEYYQEYPLETVIVHINDVHEWTRERIADWVDLLDVDLTVQPVKEAA